MERTPREEMIHFLSDLYSVELQALGQLRDAPEMAGSSRLAEFYREHLTETEQQAEILHDRLEELGESPSAVKNAVMKLGGKAFLLFAKALSETPGRLHAHSYSFEAMEWAGYEILVRLAELANDSTTAKIGRMIQSQEREMMERLESGFDVAEEVSHRDRPLDDLKEEVIKHLTEIHAIESQSIKLLEKSADTVDDSQLGLLYRNHLGESRVQIERVEERLRSLGAEPSRWKDASLKLGALNWAVFFRSQSDTATKLLAFAYAVEHLEIAGYELLARVAARAEDRETREMCRQIVPEEQAMAERLAESVDASVASLFETVRT